MIIEKLRKSIEKMPAPAYILLKYVLILCCAMLFASLMLFAAAERRLYQDLEVYHLAVLLLENPAGVLFAGGIGVAILLDRR